MKKLNWGYAYFGKKDGFELFELGGLLEDIDQSSQRNELHAALQLKLEEIRIFEGSQLYRLSQFDSKNGPVNLFTVFFYALDDYQRDGFVGTTLAIQSKDVSAGWIWKFIHTEPKSLKTIGVESPRVSTQSLVELYPPAKAYIPLFGEDPTEPFVLMKAWLENKFPSFGTLYFSANSKVADSIQGRHIQVLLENPFWEGKSKVEAGEVHQQLKVTSSGRTGLNMEPAPQSSLIHAFEGDMDNRWEKKTSKPKNKKTKKGNRIWGWLALGFVGLLSSLLWIAL